MKPPYHPSHVEQIVFADSRTSAVMPRCSCSWTGGEYRLGRPGVMQGLIADFNAHRETYTTETQ